MKLLIKSVFTWYQSKKRGGKQPDQDILTSVMLNKPPGSPNLSIMSFTGGFHGRTFGSLSTTRSNPVAKYDFPAFYWPAAPFPKLKYPLEENIDYNRKEEDRCLTEVEKMINDWEKISPVAGIVVEPIQGEGGDNHATSYFFNKLQEITQKYGVAFIVDEVQTGCGATGKFFAFEHWKLKSPPDIVTFSKKLQQSGLFSKPEFRVPTIYRNFNTWLGDPIRVLQIGVLIEEIEKHKLLEQVQVSGKTLLNGLSELQKKYSKITNSRGQGTFCAFDCESTEWREKLIQELRNKGIEIGGSGAKSIRFRPALIFGVKHVNIFLNAFETTLKQLK